MEWMLLPLKRYAEFSGRSRRLEYWMFFVLNIIIGAVLASLMLVGGLSTGIFTNPENPELAFGPVFWLSIGLGGIWVLAMFIPGLAVTVRRLHDRDMSGWWYLGLVVAQFIPFVGFLASIAFLVLMLMPGTPGPNRFGPDPKDPASAEVFA